jgi:hypothetical protein
LEIRVNFSQTLKIRVRSKMSVMSGRVSLALWGTSLRAFYHQQFSGLALGPLLKMWSTMPNSFLGGNMTNLPTEETIQKEKFIDTLNRNGRRPKKVQKIFWITLVYVDWKKANHGARPCSSVMRRLRVRGYHKRYKEKVLSDAESGKVKT